MWIERFSTSIPPAFKASAISVVVTDPKSLSFSPVLREMLQVNAETFFAKLFS